MADQSLQQESLARLRALLSLPTDTAGDISALQASVLLVSASIAAAQGDITTLQSQQSIIGAEVWVVFSDAPATDLTVANMLKPILGDRIQICDGVADDVELNAGIQALPTGGGMVRMSAGTGYCAAEVTTVHGLKLVGAGAAATVLRMADGVNLQEGVIHADGQWNRGLMADFTVDGNHDNNPSAKMGIYIQGAWYSHMTRVIVKECRTDGIYVSGPDGGGYTGECFFYGVLVHECRGDGWHISAVMDSVWLDCYEYSSEEDGFHIIGNSNTFFHCHAWMDGWNSFEITTDAKHTNMIFCNADMPGLHGFKIGACYENKWIGCNVGGPGQTTAHQYGWYIGCTYSQFIGCLIDDGDGGMDYAFYETGAADYNIYQANMIRRYAVAPMRLIGAHNIVKDNMGYIAPGEVRHTYKALTAGAQNAIALALENPELQAVYVRKIETPVTTPGGTAGAHLDMGVADDAVGTNRGTEFFNDLDANAAQMNDSWNATDGGQQTKSVRLEPAGNATDAWVVAQVVDAAALLLAGGAMVEYMGA